MIYRVFPWDRDAAADAEGSPLFVPRALQGPGRHDNPHRYGAFYASRAVVSVVAERLQRFRGRPLRDEFLRWERGLPYAVAAFDDARLTDLVELDDPRNLVARDLRPSTVATRTRKVTQRWAREIHGEGVAGFEWWSTIEASWINVTLFADRARSRLELATDPEPLSLGHPAVRDAAEAVGVLLG